MNEIEAAKRYKKATDKVYAAYAEILDFQEQFMTGKYWELFIVLWEKQINEESIELENAHQFLANLGVDRTRQLIRSAAKANLLSLERPQEGDKRHKLVKMSPKFFQEFTAMLALGYHANKE